jgi:hypothetical protein
MGCHVDVHPLPLTLAGRGAAALVWQKELEEVEGRMTEFFARETGERMEILHGELSRLSSRQEEVYAQHY